MLVKKMNYIFETAPLLKTRLASPFAVAPSMIAEYLQFLPGLFPLPTLESVIQESLGFYHQTAVDSLSSSSSLGLKLYKNVSAEREPAQGLASELLKAVQFSKQTSIEQISLEAANRYLDSTRYLIPLIYSFSRSVPTFAEISGRPIEPCLVLRDALIFLPAFFSMNSSLPRLLLYTRTQRENGVTPKILEFNSGKIFEKAGSLPKNSVLVDVGLYGTLISNLIRQGYCQQSPTVIFFASRSPFIFGWLNALANHSMLSKTPFDLVDIIRLADTLESLLKPVIINGDRGRSEELSDPISFVCANALLWAIYRFSKENASSSHSIAELIAIPEKAKKDSSSWIVRNPVERWHKAEQFLAKWEHGPLFPLSHLSGFKL